MPKGRVILVLLAAVALVLAAGPPAFTALREARIAEGVSVDGVPVGGHTPQEARRIVRERLREPARRGITVHRGDESFELTAEKAGLELDVDATVEAALQRSRAGSPWERTLRILTGGTVDADVAPRLTFDRKAVSAFADKVDRDLDHMADDARMQVEGGALKVTESQKGFRADRDAIHERLVSALEDPRSQRRIEAPGEVLEPETTTADLAEQTPLLLVVDRSDFRLRVYAGLELDKTYPIGVGRAGHETPAGRYDISDKAKNPAWYVPDEPWAGEKRGEVIPPDDPENPLAARWLGIEDGIGIHGTEDRSSIGRRASHGCIRMTVPDVKALYDRVPVGTPVHIA